MKTTKFLKVFRFLLPILLGMMLWGLLSPPSTFAATVAEQTTGFDHQLNVWAASQDLGNNLSGKVTTFTFRTLTSASFDYTAGNTRIYDKTTFTSINGCGTVGGNQKSGLTITTENVPTGYQDVTIDFSCHNYSFVSGRSYVIKISNANQCAGCLKLSAHAFVDGNDRFSSGGIRYSFDNQSCFSPMKDYQTSCNKWVTDKDDLYFILKNDVTLPSDIPVIFIPGIGGSELKTNSEINWSASNGHGGIFSNTYPANEKVWVNETQAKKLGNDDYFDVLRLKEDGETSEADISPNGYLSPFGYSGIDDYFKGLDYKKGENYFVFTYDWRKDVRSTFNSLDNLVNEAIIKSKQPTVNIVAHSMGGLVARNYINDADKAKKVNKLIELGVPHLGSVNGLKTLLYGTEFKRDILGVVKLGVSKTAVKDVYQNMTGGFQLLPSKQYYEFYNNSNENLIYPFSDERDIDNNQITNALNYSQTKDLLKNLGYNQTVFNKAEDYHNIADPKLIETNGVKTFLLVGSSQPTLGKIRETHLISWPSQVIPVKDEIMINGDDTVPLYSASLKKSFSGDSLDLSLGSKIYYVEQEHNDLVRSDGEAMQIVKSLLVESALPTSVKEEKISLSGKQVTVDFANVDVYDENNNHTGFKNSEEIEANIPNTYFSYSESRSFIFAKNNLANLRFVLKSTDDNNEPTIKIKHINNDSVEKTTVYKDIPSSKSSTIEFNLNPSTSSQTLTVDTKIISPSSELDQIGSLDITPPKTAALVEEITGGKKITLNTTDIDSGLLKIEYTLDNKTVNIYDSPLTITVPGSYKLIFYSTDKAANQEIPQTIEFTVSSSSSSSSSNSLSTDSTLSSENSFSDLTSTELLTDTPLEQSIQSILGESKTSNVIPAQAAVPAGRQGIHKNNILTPKDKSSTFLIFPIIAANVLFGLLVLSFIRPEINIYILKGLSKLTSLHKFPNKIN